MSRPNYGLTLDPDENIVRVVRRDMFVFYARLIVVFLLLLVPFVVFPLISGLVDDLTNGRGDTLLLGCYLLWFLAVWVFFFYRWTNYYLDMWVITNKRVFDIEQHGFFNREISVFPLENIQDITIEVKGFFATLIKFGNLYIHTAGEKQNLIIRDARDPQAVKDMLSKLQREAIKRLSGHKTAHHT